MKQKIIYLLLVIILWGGVFFYSAFAAYDRGYEQNYTPAELDEMAPPDTTKPPRFPVKKTSPTQYEDLKEVNPADLKTPSNINSTIEYDPVSRTYVFRTKVGDMDINTPFMLTENDYREHTLEESRKAYFRNKNAEAFAKGTNEFNFLDMQFNIKALDKVFGPGGVKIRTQGSADLSFGLKTNKIDNPALAMSARKKTYFDFDEKIQANITASVGDKMSFNMNYNTDATFDFDSKKLKLQYQGKEDEIIKNIEAGNVSMTTGSSLIRGSAALFGVKTTMQFGKLTATALVSQQESESKTINAKGGVQMTEFEIKADAYDENTHFFLGQWFETNYDRFMSKLPYISSGVSINRIEVWVTNKRGSYDQSRNIVAFMDMAEKDKLGNKYWQPNMASKGNPANNANNLYSTIQGIDGARNINMVTQALDPLMAYGIEGGRDYAKIESARKLETSEYTLNNQLGYLSLKSKLNSDEVLCVAYEYTLNGQVFQVGEFSTNITETNSCLFLKMLKGATVSTSLPIWDLMMKNVYSLRAYQIQKEKFKLNIYYQSDTTGVRIPYLPTGNSKKETLLQMMNLDRLNNNQEAYSDGFFDYVEGYTILSSNGKIIFPVAKPFGSHLRSRIGNDGIANKYVFEELYDTTLTAAQQNAEKNKFYLKGEYKSSSGAEIRLNAMNVPRGSVKVTAGGMTLTENSDYSVDYAMGVVTILNQSIIESGTPVSVSLENQSFFSMQRKTMLGLDLNYAINKNFNIGGTIMYLSEKPLREKLNVGSEVLNNMLWGLNLSYKKDFLWLTNLINKIPTVNATAPSQISFVGEFAQLIPGKPRNKAQNGISYIDDFESSQSKMDIRSPYSWVLASTPYDPNGGLFPEARLSNDIEYGKNRALMSWYYIDRLFTQQNSTLTPAHIKSDLDQLSNHFVREVNVQEIFPNRELGYGQSSILQVLNLSYYPQERGPYNMDATNINPLNGRLLNPAKRWGGIMRKMDMTDFESSNIEYIQFWVMDPFIYDKQKTNQGGDLYFNFGEISEDILKDGMKSFESGIVANGGDSEMTTTAWGKVSRRQSLTYAFDNSQGARKVQDVGLDGLNSDEEFQHNSYRNFVDVLSRTLSPEARDSMLQDPFSSLNDPAGDNYHFYRGVDYDNSRIPILDRYRRYNGTEGNSLSPEEAGDKYYQSSRSVPDVEDINQDNTLNEYERYYQYRVSLRHEDMEVGKNNITDKRTTTVKLRNGQDEEVTWYQFKIPLKEPEKKVGSINDFKTIRFARIFMTGFEQETHLRFASLELVRGEWRNYTAALDNTGTTTANEKLNVSVVNIEENAGQVPVNYILPPGISRVIDPGQSQITQLNEQSLSMKVTELSPKDACAVYKNTSLDMRNYRRLQMFIHGEQFIDDETNLQNGDLTVFMRIGSDHKSNYYEYEIPITLTPAGTYNTYSTQDQYTVWPSENMFDFPLSILTDLKTKRNAEKRKDNSTVSYQIPYSGYDPDKVKNKISVVGNPSLADVRTIMVGVRNQARIPKSAAIWVNELRLTDFNEDGGWAAKGNLNLGISDIATVNLSGIIETAGFGGVDQRLSERRLDDYYQYNFATMVELGRFLPEKAKIKAPIFYSFSEERYSPKYNPLDQDVLLKDALDAAISKAEKDSIKKYAQEKNTIESFSISGLKVDIRSKTPMPYDPANFSFSYSYNKQQKKDPTTDYENTIDYRGNFSYSYSPYVKPWEPFRFIKSKSKHLKLFKDISINYLPNNISFNTNISRFYYEQQLRDLEVDPEFSQMPLAVSKNFLWDRQFSIQWNFFKSLQLSLNTMTNARIDEPIGAVNKRLFPDEYEAWKDTVKQSIVHLGRPWNYNQTFNASYTLPLNKIPFLDFTSVTARYNSNYSWDRGVFIDDETSIGNSINNQGQWSFEGRINFESLYNKSKFLKKVNTKFGSNSSNTSVKKPEKQKFVKSIQLKKDTTTLVTHNLNNKNLRISAKSKNGNPYLLKYKVVDKNKILINTRDTALVNLTITQGRRPDESFWYKTGEYSSRLLMMVRNVNVRYRKGSSLSVPSFMPNVGDMLGQNNSGGFFSPGLDFAFGFTDESYVSKIKDRNWLLVRDDLVNPAIYNGNEEFQIDATLEPISGLKIALNANWVYNNNNQIQFMYDGMPSQRGGNFTMTHIAIGTALKGSNASNGYASKAFDDFLRNREIIASRMEQKYVGRSYPNRGFIAGTEFADTKYDPTKGKVNRSSSDVMIPAFLAAYTGQNAGNVGLSPFPSLWQILPNWRIDYTGLMRIPFIKKNLKSLVLKHAYRCTYNVGSYASLLNWIDAYESDDWGFMYDEISGCPLPSSPYDISAVTIVESFSPLIGLEATFKNNIIGRLEYKDSRNLSLNSSAGQIVEATTQDITIGAEYKIMDLKAFLRLKKSDKYQKISNDLRLRADFSFGRRQSLIRRIEEIYTQATAGTKVTTFKFSADYTLSKFISIRAFYDLQINTPLVSSTAYPITNSDIGIAIRLSLTR